MISNQKENKYVAGIQSSNPLPADDLGLRHITIKEDAIAKHVDSLIGQHIYDLVEHGHDTPAKAMPFAKISNAWYEDEIAYVEFGLIDESYKTLMDSLVDSNKRNIPTNIGLSSELGITDHDMDGKDYIVKDFFYNGIALVRNPRDDVAYVYDSVCNSYNYLNNINKDDSMADDDKIKKQKDDESNNNDGLDESNKNDESNDESNNEPNDETDNETDELDEPNDETDDETDESDESDAASGKDKLAELLEATALKSAEKAATAMEEKLKEIFPEKFPEKPKTVEERITAIEESIATDLAPNLAAISNSISELSKNGLPMKQTTPKTKPKVANTKGSYNKGKELKKEKKLSTYEAIAKRWEENKDNPLFKGYGLKIQ
jgi:hypothetical protein